VAASAYSGGLNRALAATGIVALALTAFYFLMHRYLRQRDAALAAVESSNAELEQRVIDRTTDLALLSRHLLNVREHEKKIIARDLHDDFGSYLTAINMDVSRARDKIAATNPEQAAKLDRTLGLLNSAIEMKRQLISELRPSMLDNLGLGPALEQYIEEWSRRTNIAASFDYQGDLTSNDEGGPIAIFRVFQEALTNIAKHAKATRVAAYAYRTGEAIEFEIADDGVGVTDADRMKVGTHGLLGIRERVLAYDGHFEIITGPTGGTIIRGTMPCHVSPAERPQARNAMLTA
jgi:signal transduction histidine kinase